MQASGQPQTCPARDQLGALRSPSQWSSGGTPQGQPSLGTPVQLHHAMYGAQPVPVLAALASSRAQPEHLASAQSFSPFIGAVQQQPSAAQNFGVRSVAASPGQSQILPPQLLQSSLPTLPLPARASVQQAEYNTSEQQGVSEASLQSGIHIRTAMLMHVEAHHLTIQAHTPAAAPLSAQAQGEHPRQQSRGSNDGDHKMGHQGSQVAAAAAAAGQQWLQMGSGLRALSLEEQPNDADSAVPATTAGVLQSGSSEELANALAGLTQMVSTARGMPRQQQPAVSDIPAPSQPAPDADVSHNGDPHSGLGRMAGSEAVQTRGTGGRVQEEAAAAAPCAEEVRSAKRARLETEPQMLGCPGGSQHSEQPGAVSAGLDTGLPSRGAEASHTCAISQPSQQPVISGSPPDPGDAADGLGIPFDGINAVRAVISAEGASAASLHLHVLPRVDDCGQANEGQMMGSAAEHAGDAEVDHSFSAGSGDAQDRQLRSILR
jgi:hypothetical protein